MTCTLYHLATGAIYPLTCSIYVRGGLFRKAFTFNLYKTCYTCLGPVFRYKFNGDAHFGIGLTKKGNLLVLYVFCTVFQREFNCDSHYVMWGILQVLYMSGTCFLM